MTAYFQKDALHIGRHIYGVLAVATRCYEMIGKAGLISPVITNMHHAGDPMGMAGAKQTRI